MTIRMPTPWGEQFDREHPLPEYPRPQLVRDSYLNLNGVWWYAITDTPDIPDVYEDEIVVPYSPESPLSGVGVQLDPQKYLQYYRPLEIPEGFSRGRLLLHFEAVDQIADVFLNGVSVGRHEGGYLPFVLDITDAVQPGENELCVTVRDNTLSPLYGRGKQRYRRLANWFTAQSGIWQTVWLESVPEVYVESLRITPLYDEGQVKIEAVTHGAPAVFSAKATAEGATVAEGTFENNVCTLSLPAFHSWTPEDPFLYDLEICADEDCLRSYFAMRKFSYAELDGHRVFALNDVPYFHCGVLDQGYWSDGLMTPPADDALINDIATMKRMGFNMLRKHCKVECRRYYYHCDRLGMLVWQDMVNGGGNYDVKYVSLTPNLGLIKQKDDKYEKTGRKEEASREFFLRECRGTVELLYNHPCIALWTIFTEGWGQFDALQTAAMVEELDPTRFIDHASGWHDQGREEIQSRHIYNSSPSSIHSDGRALCLSECGGFSFPIPGHLFAKQPYSEKSFSNREEYMAAYFKLMDKQVCPLIEKEGLTAMVYTQLSDVELSTNGLLTYDRKVQKIPEPTIREHMRKLRFDVPGAAGETPEATGAEESGDAATRRGLFRSRKK